MFPDKFVLISNSNCEFVGIFEAGSEGFKVDNCVGDEDNENVGVMVGIVVALPNDKSLGAGVLRKFVGEIVGRELGSLDESNVGDEVCRRVGSRVLSILEGGNVGCGVGTFVGLLEGLGIGFCVGSFVGADVGELYEPSKTQPVTTKEYN